MRSFFDLIGFEYKKIFQRKGSVIALIIVTLIVLISPALILTGNVYVDGELVETGYEAMVKDRAYERELSGRFIDETLFAEVIGAYAKIPLVERYTTTPEYEQYGRPYSAVFYIMRQIFDVSDMQSMQNITIEKMQSFYQIRHEQVSDQINALNISDQSKEKLIRLDSEIKTPLVFSYDEGYDRFITIMYTTGILTAFAIAICLAPMFAGEYSTGASELILSSKFGKSKLIPAKLFTAISFSAGFCALLMAFTYLICGIIFGFDGAEAPFHLQWFLNPYPLNAFQAAVIFSVCILAGIIFTGAITLFLSAKFKSPFGVIIIISILTFVPMMLSVSENNILLYNLFRLLPVNMMSAGWVFSYVPYELFGLSVAPYVFMPLFSLFVTAIILPVAYRSFKNHQIG